MNFLFVLDKRVEAGCATLNLTSNNFSPPPPLDLHRGHSKKFPQFPPLLACSLIRQAFTDFQRRNVDIVDTKITSVFSQAILHTLLLSVLF